MSEQTLVTINRRTALIDLLLVIGTLLILKSLLLQLESLWSSAGPISLLAALAVATWRLRRNQETWRGLGLTRPENMKRALIWTLVALLVTMAVGAVAQSLAGQWLGDPSDATQAIDARYQGRFDALPGNLPTYLFWLGVAWVIGGFAEEMLLRGALLSSFESMFAGLPFPAILAAFSQAILFGQQHYYYQGMAGAVATGAIGLTSGLLYLTFKRNLWPLILSHGLSNTIGLTLIYLQG